MKKLTASLLLALSLSACQAADLADSPFPLWEDAEEPAAVEGIVMELVSMEDMHLDQEPDHEPYLDWRVLKVKFGLEEELWNPEPGYSRLDYLYNGTWHTVYRPWIPRQWTLVARCIGPGECEREFAVPACALWRSGEYRICHEDLGTFEFTIE